MGIISIFLLLALSIGGRQAAATQAARENHFRQGLIPGISPPAQA